jgi:predicted dehydrogenase
MKKVKVGVIGCGNISDLYLKNCTDSFSHILEIDACSDMDIERAKIKAETYGIPKVLSVKEIILDPEIEIILNLTFPKSHAEINLAVLEAGKNIYTEKPLAVRLEDGLKIIKTAKKKGLLVGCAPDTFLGGGLQTCRKLIDEGFIGKPIAAVAFFADHGPESWHPDPGYYYKPGGGGPLYEIGPYLLTALINLLGPIKSIGGFASMPSIERTITSQPKYGQKIKVETPTHISCVLDFENGALGTILVSYEIWHKNLPSLEIYGTEGTLNLGVPLYEFSGPVHLRRYNEPEWKEIKLTHGYTDVLRGLGTADMGIALRKGGLNRANGELAYHILEVINGFYMSVKEGKKYDLVSRCGKPEPMPVKKTHSLNPGLRI